MEEGSLCLTSAAYPGSAKPMDKGQIPRDLKVFWVFWNYVISLSIAFVFALAILFSLCRFT